MGSLQCLPPFTLFYQTWHMAPTFSPPCYRLRASFPILATHCMFRFAQLQLHVFLCIALFACFLAHTLVCFSALGIGCVIACAQHVSILKLSTAGSLALCRNSRKSSSTSQWFVFLFSIGFSAVIISFIPLFYVLSLQVINQTPFHYLGKKSQKKKLYCEMKHYQTLRLLTPASSTSILAKTTSGYLSANFQKK